jgi:anti-sigma factor ChrR (cupin superfamily)
MPWEFIPISFLNDVLPVKTCLQDPDTGMMVWKLRYPAGFRTVEHWHNCAHGMYVLEGHLVTSEGEFGPGSFVWFPSNVIESRYFKIVDYPTAAALSFTLMAAILILVTIYIRKAGTEELV